jgi:4-amino-4-deoxy-L-arabinose transferase-like glycosyltransferase
MRKTILPLLIFSALLLTLSVTSLRRNGITFDENVHLPAGYTYLTRRDFRMNPEHPPLAKALAAAPLLFLHPQADWNDQTWKNSQQERFGAKFLYEWNDGDRLLFWGRLPIVLLSLLLGAAVFCCARELYGWKAGCLALALYLLTPDLIAHGQIVTTDLPITAFMFTACYFFYRTLRRVTVWNVAVTCLAVGLALVTKFSSGLLFPMLALVGVAFALSPEKMLICVGGKAGRVVFEKGRKLAAAFALIVAALLVGVAVIWASYGFRYSISPDPEVSSRLNWSSYLQQPGATMSGVFLARDLRLLPEGYTYGFGHVLRYSMRRVAFVLGEQSNTGFWYYFPVTFLVKTPVALILFILLGGALLRRYGAGLAAEGLLLLPAGFYFLYSMTTNMNIGNRHILPIYPFLIVFAAKTARAFDELAPSAARGAAKKEAGWRQKLASPRALTLACAVLLLWQAAAVAFVYPHFLSYFNEIAGGPSNGHRWLVDSNLDWGQDLKGLANYRRQHPDEPLYLCYFGSGNPDYYGLGAKLLPGWPMYRVAEFRGPGYTRFDDIPPGATVAVSATYLRGVYLNDVVAPGVTRFLDRLKRLEPVDRVGYSIFIYKW